MENLYETHSPAIFQGPMTGGLPIVPMHLIHFLSFGEGFFYLFVLLDFAFSLQLCFITDYLVSKSCAFKSSIILIN